MWQLPPARELLTRLLKEAEEPPPLSLLDQLLPLDRLQRPLETRKLVPATVLPQRETKLGEPQPHRPLPAAADAVLNRLLPPKEEMAPRCRLFELLQRRCVETQRLVDGPASGRVTRPVAQELQGLHKDLFPLPTAQLEVLPHPV